MSWHFGDMASLTCFSAQPNMHRQGQFPIHAWPDHLAKSSSHQLSRNEIGGDNPVNSQSKVFTPENSRPNNPPTLPLLLGTKLTVPSAVIYRSDRNYKTNRGAYLKAAQGPTGGVDYYW